MYKKLLFTFLLSIAFFGLCFSHGDNNVFENDLYTDMWTGYDSNSCGPIQVNHIIEFPENLKENTIYILDTGNIFAQTTVKIGDCTAIIGSSGVKKGTLIDNSIYSGDVFLITGKYVIIDNLQISGTQKEGQYGIMIENTNNVTLNNIKIKGLYGGIYSSNTHNSKYINISISGIYEYPFILKNSNNNYVENVQSSYNLNEAGLQIEDSFSNTINSCKLFKNYFQGLVIFSGVKNEINRVEAYDNEKQGLYILLGNGNIINQSSFFENKKEGIYIGNGGYNNEFYNTNVYNNGKVGIVVFGTGNKFDGVISNHNENGISIYSSNNTIWNYEFFNNKMHGMLVMTGSDNVFHSGYIYNNSSHGILLYNASHNTVTSTQTFNNGQIISGSSRCGIMLYGSSNNNSFKDTSIYNNLIGVCFETNGHTISRNTFENMKILNNKTNESSNGKLTGNIFSGIITTFGSTKTGNLSERTGKTTKTGVQLGLVELKTGDQISLTGFNIIRPGISLIQRIVKPSFDYMINPHVGGIYLYSRGSEYSDIIGYDSRFLNIEDKQPNYSIGIMIQSEITGYIISNGINVVADGNINSYNIRGNKYVGNKLKNTLIERMSTGDVKNTVATNINGKDIHAMLVLDTEAPTCKIEYSTTGETTENVIAMLTGCSEEIAGTDLTYTFTKNDIYTFEFTDLVGNSGSTEANVSRIKPKPSGNGGGGGGGGGGGTVNNETNNTTNNSGNNNSGDNNKFTFNTGIFDSDYSEEMNMAYQYAYYYKITTQKSIKDTAMYDGLTRIAMAKMLSYYAINVLKKNPDTSKYSKCLFDDLTPELIDQYDNGGTLSCQLGIMGVGIEKFRPFDPVTRAEFATALSRLLYGTTDGTDTYYSTHLNKLLEKGIIANTDPNLQELRGYVMIMLMRSALGISSVEDFVYPEPEPQEQEVVKYFTEPYKKGQIYSRIGDLQDLLRYLGYYKYGTNYVYSKATINAVYDFQVAMGLIDADDVNNPARGYLGPETRNALNEKWAEFQQYKNGIANQ